MLANALFCVALIALATMTTLSAGLAMTRATVHRLAQTYLSAGYQRAAASVQERLAAQLAAGGPPEPLPTFTPLPAQCVDSGIPCVYTTSATIALGNAPPAPAPGATCDPKKSNCARNEEANPYVGESRLSARISVRVSAADGTLLATRSSALILRTFPVWPYVTTAGARDGSFDSASAGAAAGDDGGSLPATPNPCASGTPAATDDSVVRVEYRNSRTNACTDGSAWRDGSYSQRADAPAGWSP